MISLGKRSLVNWMRRKVPATLRARAAASVVLPTPGTSSNNRCPPAIKVSTARSTTCGLPHNARSQFVRNAAANSAAALALRGWFRALSKGGLARSPLPSAGLNDYVSFTVRGGSEEARERALEIAVAAGAVGAEERSGPPPALIVFAREQDREVVEAALRQAVGEELEIGQAVPVADIAWSEAWKEGLAPLVVSPRLAITPSFVPFEPAPGQFALVIDPGQAFGTGRHASTRLALEILAGLPETAIAGRRVLDVGCGTGILALAALGLGAREALALDLDPLATEATRENAARNHLEAGLRVWTGPLDALDGGPFDLVLANMIHEELLPLLEGIRARCCDQGQVILSGILSEEGTQVERELGSVGLRAVETRRSRDELGDHWLAFCCIPTSG